MQLITADTIIVNAEYRHVRFFCQTVELGQLMSAGCAPFGPIVHHHPAVLQICPTDALTTMIQPALLTAASQQYPGAQNDAQQSSSHYSSPVIDAPLPSPPSQFFTLPARIWRRLASSSTSASRTAGYQTSSPCNNSGNEATLGTASGNASSNSVSSICSRSRLST